MKVQKEFEAVAKSLTEKQKIFIDLALKEVERLTMRRAKFKAAEAEALE